MHRDAIVRERFCAGETGPLPYGRGSEKPSHARSNHTTPQCWQTRKASAASNLDFPDEVRPDSGYNETDRRIRVRYSWTVSFGSRRTAILGLGGARTFRGQPK